MTGLALATLAAKATAVLALAFLLDRLLVRASAALRHAAWAAGFAALVLLPLATLAVPPVSVALLPAERTAVAGEAEIPSREGRPGKGDAARATAPAEPGDRSRSAAAGAAVAAAAAASPAAGPGPRPAAASSRPPEDGGPGGVAPGWGSSWRSLELPLAGPFGPASADALSTAAAVVYGLVLLVLLARVALGLLAVRALTRRARSLADDPAWSAVLAGLPSELARLRPRLLATPELSVPVVWGLRRPAVLLPDAARSWSAEERRRVLIHELAHGARRDWGWEMAARLACAAWWPHPLVWAALRRLRLEAERACDDRVVAAGADGCAYAGQLVRLARGLGTARRSAASSAPAGALAMAGRSHLAARVRSLLDAGRSRSAARPAGVAALAAAVLLPALLLAPVRPVSAAAADDGGGAAWPRVAALGSGLAAAFAPAEPSAPDPAAPRRATPRTGDPALPSGGPDRRDEMTPLMRAVFDRRWQEAERLLAAGADPDEGRRSFGTPLILAAEAADPALVRLLLEHGADPNVAETGPERPRDLQRTPLGNAARSGNLEVVDLLLDAGAEVDAAPLGDGTPLLIAAEAGHLSVVRRFVARGALVDAAIRGDGTPLTVAAREGHAAVVDALLAAGADLDLGVEGDGNPLIMAAAHGHRGIAERLLAAGADPDVWVPGDESALYQAVERGDAPMVRLLLDHGADPDATREERPVEVAAERGDRPVVDLLLAAGARPLPGRSAGTPAGWLR